MKKQVHLLVSGRVQMVMFRDYVERSARSLGLVGWVKNLPDGKVEVLAQGEEEILKGFIESVRKGSMLSRVDSVAVAWEDLGHNLDRFSIVYE